jgi:hypothetical protein
MPNRPYSMRAETKQKKAKDFVPDFSLKEALKKHCISPAKAADKIGLSRDTAYNHVYRGVVPTRKNQEKWKRILGYSLWTT